MQALCEDAFSRISFMYLQATATFPKWLFHSVFHKRPHKHLNFLYFSLKDTGTKCGEASPWGLNTVCLKNRL